MSRAPGHSSRATNRAMPRKRILITGAAGQDGSYLVEHVVGRGDEVVGIVRHETTALASPGVTILQLDVSSTGAVRDLIRDLRPDECYHLAAYHRSSQAAGMPDSPDELTAEEVSYLQVNLLSTHALLANLRQFAPSCRVFLAGSSHLFGDVTESPQNEQTPMAPNSLYGITKHASLQLGRLYRQQHGMFVVTGILYNHESPRRRSGFVTTQVARAAVEVLRHQRSQLILGDLDAQVDWGFAGDYVRAMALMLRAPSPEEMIIASGKLHTVRDLARLAFAHVGLEWSDYVQQRPGVHRRVSRAVYHGDITKIVTQLGWQPETTFEELVCAMVDHYLAVDASEPDR
jgi:GDPmannose 4,6-dehydratase